MYDARPTELCGAGVVFEAAPPPPVDPVVDRWLYRGAARLVADPTRAWLDVPGVACFVVEHGKRVTVDLAAVDLTSVDLAATSVPMWLYGTVAALVLGQRGVFALHASTVLAGAGGLALTGRSGAGKSTTALALAQHGHRLVADDVSPVRFTPGAAGVEVVPFGRPVHVWPQTATALGLDVRTGQPVAPDLAKLSLPSPAAPPVPLRALVLLRHRPDATEVECAPVPAAATADMFRRNAYRVRLLSALWGPELVAWAVRLSRAVPLWTVTRPTDGWSVGAVVGQVTAIAHRVRTR